MSEPYNPFTPIHRKAVPTDYYWSAGNPGGGWKSTEVVEGPYRLWLRPKQYALPASCDLPDGDPGLLR